MPRRKALWPIVLGWFAAFGSRKRWWLGGALLVVLIGVALFVACRPQPAASIVEVTLARAVDENGRPLERVSAFRADDPAFHCVVELTDGPADTRVRVVFVAVNALDQPNLILDEAETLLSGRRTLNFHLDRTGGYWPPGRYQVELYLNDTLAHRVEFQVEPASTPSAAAG